jgi:hypothetical protein
MPLQIYPILSQPDEPTLVHSPHFIKHIDSEYVPMFSPSKNARLLLQGFPMRALHVAVAMPVREERTRESASNPYIHPNSFYLNLHILINSNISFWLFHLTKKIISFLPLYLLEIFLRINNLPIFEKRESVNLPKEQLINLPKPERQG